MQTKQGKFSRNIRDEFSGNSCRRLAMQHLRRVSQILQKVFCGNPPKKQVTTRKIGHEKQISLQLDQVNFKEQAISSLLAADIPLHELNHPYLKSLFATMEKVLPLETAARACVAKLASQKEEQIQQLLCDKKIFNCGRSRSC